MENRNLYDVLMHKRNLTVKKLRETIETQWHSGGHFDTVDIRISLRRKGA